MIIKKERKEAIKNYLDFLWAMTEKEIKSRYKRAMFGFLWVILNPFFQMLIIGFIFSFFIKIPNYFTFLFTGLLPWQFFSLSLSKATSSFVNERSLLQKSKFPKEAIPISIILSNFFNLLISLGLLITFLVIMNRINFIQLILIFPALIWLLVFTIGISLLTASLNVRFRDIAFFVQTLLILWFYATPVLYSLNLMPEKIRTFFGLNPLAAILELFHLSLMGEAYIGNAILGLSLLVTAIIVLLGVQVYRKQHSFFVDWL